MKKITIQKITQNNWNFLTVNLIVRAKKLLTSRQIFRYAVPARTVTKSTVCSFSVQLSVSRCCLWLLWMYGFVQNKMSTWMNFVKIRRFWRRFILRFRMNFTAPWSIRRTGQLADNNDELAELTTQTSAVKNSRWFDFVFGQLTCRRISMSATWPSSHLLIASPNQCRYTTLWKSTVVTAVCCDIRGTSPALLVTSADRYNGCGETDRQTDIAIQRDTHRERERGGRERGRCFVRPSTAIAWRSVPRLWSAQETIHTLAP